MERHDIIARVRGATDEPMTEGAVHERVRQALEASGTSFVVHRHSGFPVPIHRPEDVARCLGYEIDRIVKTLFLRAEPAREFCLVSVPASRRVSLSSAARALQVDAVFLATPDELRTELGYPARGVSPLGAGERRVLVDARLLEFPTVLIGAGAGGIDIELDTSALMRLTLPTVVDVCEPAG